MAKFTYEDFEKALKSAGMENGFSEADRKLAQTYPEAGMSLISAKKAWQTASTPAEKAAAHARAEAIRASYGNYSGGADGADYIVGGLSNASFSPPASPVYESPYAEALQKAADRVTGDAAYVPSGSAPVYENRYSAELAAALSDAAGRGDFVYDPEKSALNSAVKKQYARMIDRAAEGTLAAASAQNGGRASSYAATAAAQAANLAAAEYADRQLDVARLEMQIYDANYEAALARLRAVQGAEQTDYDRYLDELAEYGAGEKRALAAWQANHDRLTADADTLTDLEKLSQSAYKTSLDQYMREQELAYDVLADEVARRDRQSENELERALAAAKYGDDSGLAALGIDASRYRADEDYRKRLESAELAAKYGDYSGLSALGVNTSGLQKKAREEAAAKAKAQRMELAELAAKYGDYSGLAALGVDVSAYRASEDYRTRLERARLAAQYGDYSLLEELGIRPFVE